MFQQSSAVKLLELSLLPLCCPAVAAVQHRALIVKRLHTTVEEDASTKARLAGLSANLEAAAAEKLQLEHRLKLQRLEQAKAAGTLQVRRH
jgi:hypothetical protein